MKITVSTLVAAPLALVWHTYTSPDDILVWNTASPDWHTTSAQVDPRAGGKFSSRMEAKDRSFGPDFEGTYTQVVPQERLEGYADQALELISVVLELEHRNGLHQPLRLGIELV